MRRCGVASVAAVAAAVVALTVAACGGGGGSSDAVRSARAATTTARAAVGGPQPVDTAFSGKGSEQYCKLARTYADASAKLSSNSGPDLRQLFADAARDIKTAVTVAPAEIRGDVQIVADGFSALVSALTAVNYDFTRLPADIIARLMSADYTTASTRVAAYSRNICGLAGTTG